MLKKDIITKLNVVHEGLDLARLLMDITEGVNTMEKVCANLKSL